MIQARVKIIDTAKRNTRIVWLYLGACNIHARVVSFFSSFFPLLLLFYTYVQRACVCVCVGGGVDGGGGGALGGCDL